VERFDEGCSGKSEVLSYPFHGEAREDHKKALTRTVSVVGEI
jgi:hypothetical protein